jgi:hypothetical protein
LDARPIRRSTLTGGVRHARLIAPRLGDRRSSLTFA